MKSRGGKSQRRAEKRRRKKIKKRKSQKKEDPGARKGRKVAKHSVFPMSCGSGRSKSRLAEPVGQMRDEKLHAVVARSTFRSQNVQNTPAPDHFWKLRCRKIARRWGAKHISKPECIKHTRCGPLLEVEMSKNCTPLWREAHVEAKCTKHTSSGPLLEVEMSKNCTPLWHEAHFEVKMYKAHQVRTTFGSWDVEKLHAVVARSTFRSQNVQSTPGLDHFWKLRCCFAWQAHGIVHLVKNEQTWGFCSISKNDGRRGTFEEDLQRCIFRGRRSTRDMFIRAVRRSGRWFPESGCILERQISSFRKMILRDRCSTSYDLASLFRGRRSSLDRWSRKIAKRIGTRPSALPSTLHFWRKSRRIASFLSST